jgi:glycyl-tRNA synthetase beta chain
MTTACYFPISYASAIFIQKPASGEWNERPESKALIFFFEDDLKIPLDQRVEQLKKVVFQAKLGTSYEKVMRFKRLALWITERIDPKLREMVDRTSLLCKADLVTGMVGEFPKLQGIVGREYARLSKEKPEVCRGNL